MSKRKRDAGEKAGIAVAVLAGLYVLMCVFGSFPVPRGTRVDSDCYAYYRNFMGVYYITVEHSAELFNHGHWGYLKDVDEQTFEVLNDSWAKDATHVWWGDELIKDVDAKTFHINAGGVAADKSRVYIRDFTDGDTYIRPSRSGIDVETAEYFVWRVGEMRDEWMRDKDFIYYNDKRTDVDRGSFEVLEYDWFVDKDYVYVTVYNDRTQQWDLRRVDSLQTPIEAGYLYFRNGRNIIYGAEVIVRDIDVYRFEDVGPGRYMINDMLFVWGKREESRD